MKKVLLIVLIFIVCMLNANLAIADGFYKNVLDLKNQLEEIYYEGLDKMQSGAWIGRDANRYDSICDNLTAKVKKWKEKYKYDTDKIDRLLHAIRLYKINVVLDMAFESPELIQHQNEVFDKIDGVLEELESEGRGD